MLFHVLGVIISLMVFIAIVSIIHHNREHVSTFLEGVYMYQHDTWLRICQLYTRFSTTVYQTVNYINLSLIDGVNLFRKIVADRLKSLHSVVDVEH